MGTIPQDLTNFKKIVEPNLSKMESSCTDLSDKITNCATYAKTAKIGSKSDTRNNPAKLRLTNFGFNLPKGAEVKRIIVMYSHQKLDDAQGKYPSISAPYLFLKNTDMEDNFKGAYGNAPQSTLQNKTKTWDGKLTATAVSGSSTQTSGDYVGKYAKTEYGKYLRRIAAQDFAQYKAIYESDLFNTPDVIF